MKRISKKLRVVISLALVFLMCFGSVGSFASAKKEFNITIDGQECNIRIIYEDIATKIVRSQDGTEISVAAYDKITEKCKLISFPINKDTIKISDKQLIKEVLKSKEDKKKNVSVDESYRADFATEYQSYDLDNSVASKTPVITSYQSSAYITLNYSKLMYAYYGAHTLINKGGDNIRIAGSVAEGDHILYTEIDNFEDTMYGLKSLETETIFETAGLIISGLLAIPDITVSKIAAALVAAGVVVFGVKTLWSYWSGCNRAESYYNDVTSRLDNLGVSY